MAKNMNTFDITNSKVNNNHTFFIQNIKIIGTPRKVGPESEMVMDFIHHSLPCVTNGEYRTVFIEPRIGSLTPDIVIIFWDPEISGKWPYERTKLNLLDIQIMQMLHISGAMNESELSKYFPRRLVRISLDLLMQVGCVVYESEKWQLNNFNNLFVISRIMAIEAKRSFTSKAIEQAIANTWFASESYILIPAKHPRPKLIELADKNGIGIYTYSNNSSELKFPAKIFCIPLSYGTWVLNELVWKCNHEDK